MKVRCLLLVQSLLSSLNRTRRVSDSSLVRGFDTVRDRRTLDMRRHRDEDKLHRPSSL